MAELAGKVAFITGGGSGVGLGQAIVFGRAGVRVVIADIRRDHLDHALSELRSRSIACHAIELDVTDRAAFARAADEAESVFGPIDLLFNTAGISLFVPLEQATYADYDWTMEVNFGGVVNGIVTFLPRMLARERGGHIVNTASISAFLPSPNAGIYCASKFAVRGLSDSLRAALAPHGIGVSLLCPMNVNTNIADSIATRPERHRNTGYQYDAKMIDCLRRLYAEGMDPIELAEHVLVAVQNNQPYIIPFPEARAPLVAQLEAVLAALPPEDSDPEGVARRNAALARYRAEVAELRRTDRG
jgi:NADP-dependent 3-hydroxy acid dehydrogenase YdfG